MGIFSNRVEKNELEAGDHIYTWRAAFTYAHHGIYMGEGKVVHFTNVGAESGLSSTRLSSLHPKTSRTCVACEAAKSSKQTTSGVIVSCLSCFLGIGSLYRFQYGVSALALAFKLRGGTCHTANSDPAHIVIERALDKLENGFGEYNVFTNNCEDFASYCKTGSVCSREPSYCQVSSAFGGTAAAIFFLSQRMAAPK